MELDRSFKALELSKEAINSFLKESRYIASASKYNFILNSKDSKYLIKSIGSNKSSILKIFNLLHIAAESDVLYPEIIKELKHCMNMCKQSSYTNKSYHIENTNFLIKSIQCIKKYYPKIEINKDVIKNIKLTLGSKEVMYDILKIHLDSLSHADRVFNKDHILLDILSETSEMRNDFIKDIRKYGRCNINIDHPLFISDILKELGIAPYDMKLKSIISIEDMNSFVNFFGEQVVPADVILDILDSERLEHDELSYEDLIDEFDSTSICDNQAILAEYNKNTLSKRDIALIWMVHDVLFSSRIFTISSKNLTDIINNSRTFVENEVLKELNDLVYNMFENSCFCISKGYILDNTNTLYNKHNLGNGEPIIAYGVTFNQSYIESIANCTYKPVITLEQSEKYTNITEKALNVKKILEELKSTHI